MSHTGNHSAGRGGHQRHARRVSCRCTLYAAMTGESPAGLPDTLILPENYDFPIPVRIKDREAKIAVMGANELYPLEIATCLQKQA